MILRRLGNKSQIATEIQKYFPQHKFYIEPFFGAGGMFFNKPKVKFNIVNDLDSDVFNLFQVVRNNKAELEEQMRIMPIHSDLLNYWKKTTETDPIKRALRFVFLSNFTFMGSGASLAIGDKNTKDIFYENLNKTTAFITDVQFANYDFRKFIKSLDRPINANGADSCFIYCDPPYLDTDDNYSNSFVEQDASDLFDCLVETGCKFAYSEFDNEFILNQAKERGLNVIIIGERKNLKNRRTEILITNYEKQKGLFD